MLISLLRKNFPLRKRDYFSLNSWVKYQVQKEFWIQFLSIYYVLCITYSVRLRIQLWDIALINSPFSASGVCFPGWSFFISEFLWFFPIAYWEEKGKSCNHDGQMSPRIMKLWTNWKLSFPISCVSFFYSHRLLHRVPLKFRMFCHAKPV